MRAALVGIAAAALLWAVMFSPLTAGRVNFWALMFPAAALLGAYALLGTPGRRLRAIYRWRRPWPVVGIVAAAALYGVFVLGDLLTGALFPAAERQIARIYDIRGALPAWAIALGLALLVGPAEEVFWRGFVQDRLQGRFGPLRGMLLGVAAYTGVHLWSLNPMLILAAGVCGLFWGWMFVRFRNVWPGIISHALWDVTIFILAPVGASA